MLSHLPLRLFLTYCVVTLLALVLLGSIFTAVLASSATAVRVNDMRSETSSVTSQLDRALARGARTQTIQQLIRHDSVVLRKRIILMNGRGQVRFDSARWTPFSRGSWRMVDLGAVRQGRWAHLGAGRRIGLQSPLFVNGRLAGAVALVVTSADTGIPWGTLVPALLRALAALFAVWLVIAIVLARSLSRPLRHVSAGLLRVRDGEYDRPVPEEGWSEARSLARRYNEMVAEVARSRQMQRDLVANAAHELKTPVALVTGFARSLSDGTAARGGAEKDAVDYIRRESENLAHIVDQLLTLASLDADLGALNTSPCQPEEVVRNAVARFKPRARAAGMNISLRCDEAMPECEWDQELVASALANILANALEHSGRGGDIDVRAVRQLDTVVIEIQDSGNGVPAEDLPHLFERFYRGKGRRIDGHAGLGLSLVREIAERHMGSVDVVSQTGSGACFRLTLPIAGALPGDSLLIVDEPRISA